MKKQIFIALLAILVLGSACTGPGKIVNKFYVIEKPLHSADSALKTKPLIDGYCEIVPVTIYPAFASTKIANRSGSHEIVYYSFHQWAVLPGESFTLIMEDYMVNNAIFKGATTRFWKINPEYRLKTTVYKLEIVQNEERLSAHLVLKFTLLNNDDNKAIINHQAMRLESLDSNQINLFASIISEMFYEELDKFTAKIIQLYSKK